MSAMTSRFHLARYRTNAITSRGHLRSFICACVTFVFAYAEITLITLSHPGKCFQQPYGRLPRRQLLGTMTGLGLSSMNAADAGAVDAALDPRKELFEELKRQQSAGGTTPSSSERCEQVLDHLTQLNPTTQPGAFQGFGARATGRWRVAHAPHIAKLSGLLGAVFDPIFYDLDAPELSRGGGDIQSHVRYSLLGGQIKGWLSTSGDYGTDDGNITSRVDWTQAWWDATSAETWSVNPEDGTFAPLVTALGKLGFVSSFAKFPVQYLDDDICVFVFPLSGTRILAIRTGSPMDIWK